MVSVGIKSVGVVLSVVIGLSASQFWGIGLVTQATSAVPIGGKAPSKKARRAPQDVPAVVRTRCLNLLDKAAKEIENGDGSLLENRLLAEIAVLQTRLKDPIAAQKTFEKSLDFVQKRRDATEYYDLARAHAQAGNVDQAIVMARMAGKVGADHENWTFRLVAEALAKERLGNEAMRAIKAYPDPKTRSSVRANTLKHLAIAQARAGDFDTGLATAKTIDEPLSQVMALTGVVVLNFSFDYPEENGIALLQAEDGDLAGARKTIGRASALMEKVTDPADLPQPEYRGVAKAIAQATVVAVQAQIGDLSEALALARKIPNNRAKTIALSAVARALGKAKRYPEAMKVFDGLTDQAMKVHFLMNLGVGQAEAGDRKVAKTSLKQAVELLDRLDERSQREHAHYLGSAQARVGDYQAGRETVKRFAPNEAVSWSSVAYFQAKDGDIAGALQQAREFEHSRRGYSFRSLARMHTAQKGDREPMGWLNMAESSFERGNVLVGVAEGLMLRASAGK